MKKIFFYILLLVVGSAAAQTDTEENANNKPQLVELEKGNLGLVLQWVASVDRVKGATEGDFLFDAGEKKIKYRKSGKWLSIGTDIITIKNREREVSIDKTHDTYRKGKATDKNKAVAGILQLSETRKALVLQKVASPHYHIAAPVPGMIYYDTDSNMLAVYNGVIWSFCKPYSKRLLLFAPSGSK